MPRLSHPSVRLALKPRGFALPVAPPDEVASCPASLHPQALPATDSRVASRLTSFSASSREAQVAPLFNSPFAPLDASPGLPRLLHLPALPAMDLRVAPNLASFSAPVASTPGRPAALAFPVAPANAFPGLPRFLHLPALPATDSRVASRLASFGASGAGASGCPSAPLFRLRLPGWLRVAPHPAPSGFALGLSLRVTPNPRSLGAG